MFLALSKEEREAEVSIDFLDGGVGELRSTSGEDVRETGAVEVSKLRSFRLMDLLRLVFAGLDMVSICSYTGQDSESICERRKGKKSLPLMVRKNS